MSWNSVSCQMKLLVLATFFVGLSHAFSTVNYMENFEEYHSPERDKACAPFRMITTKDDITETIMKSTRSGLLQCEHEFPNDDQGILAGMFLNIYQEGQVKTVNGRDFWNNPGQYFSMDAPCVQFIIGGFMTDCGVDADRVAKEADDWRYRSAHDQNTFRGCVVIVVNFGRFACQRYTCLVHTMVPRMGLMFGQLFIQAQFNLETLELVGLSIGAHIFGFACQHTWNVRRQRISMLVCLEIAAPLYERSFVVLPGYVRSGVVKGMAAYTVAIYTNPGFMGSNHFDRADLNILINPQTDFTQLGAENTDKPLLYNHAFAILIFAAICGNANIVGLELRRKPQTPFLRPRPRPRSDSDSVHSGTGLTSNAAPIHSSSGSDSIYESMIVPNVPRIPEVDAFERSSFASKSQYELNSTLLTDLNFIYAQHPKNRPPEYPSQYPSEKSSEKPSDDLPTPPPLNYLKGIFAVSFSECFPFFRPHSTTVPLTTVT